MMDYTEFKTQHGNKLYIFDHGEDRDDAIGMIARTRKIRTDNLVAVPVLIREDHGYTLSTAKAKGFKERVAIMKRSLWEVIGHEI